MGLRVLSDGIHKAIRLIRGHRVMLDNDLAALYCVPTKVLNQAMKRNRARFPADFMFRLTPEESDSLRSQIVTLEPGRGKYPKYRPYAFTEQAGDRHGGPTNRAHKGDILLFGPSSR